MKSGVYTSEFWLSIASLVSMLAVAIALIVTDQTEQIAAIVPLFGIGAGLSSAGYSIGRSIVKSRS